MNESDKVYFEKIKKEAENNPFIKVEAASKQIAEILRKSSVSKDGVIQGDLWAYMEAALTGICCGKVAALNAERLMVENASVPNYIGLMKLESETGDFYVGDAINEYLFNSNFSVCNTVAMAYSDFYKCGQMPDVRKLEKSCISNLGKKDYRLWDNLHNPYEEKIQASETYDSINNYLKPFELNDSEKVMAYGMALATVVSKVEDVFPKELNCMEMCIETVICYAHMDYHR